MSKRALPTLEPRFLTIPQAAKVVGLSADTLHKHVRSGRLKAKRTASTGGKTLVRVADLDDWFAQLEDA